MRVLRSRGRAFALIELLTVVAMIALLALTAVHNFLEAQTQAKISRVKADMHSVTTALEAYCVDFNKHPYALNHSLYLIHLIQLTTPIAYITSVSMRNSFTPKDTPDDSHSLCHFNYEDTYW